jgi:hypothetical protein
VIAAVVSVLVVPAASSGTGTKQNGQSPLFNDFTPICAVPGYVNYGNCAGDPTTYANVRGKINAMQPKPGRWNLGISFVGLEPGRYYKLWGNQQAEDPSRGDISGFFPIAVAIADTTGRASFSYQTTNPSYLGFDLNVLEDANEFRGTTVTTSYWSSQRIQVLNADGTLYVPVA